MGNPAMDAAETARRDVVMRTVQEAGAALLGAESAGLMNVH
jgi:hypothetical protein